MIVAIESASTDLSLAIAGPDGTIVAHAGWTAGRRQGSELLPRLLALLDTAGRAITDVTSVAVGIGPGSFTGLRVGMSIGKGVALGLGVPIVAVPSLEAWLAAEPGAAGAVARAGARDAYLLERGASAPVLVERDQVSGRDAVVIAPHELAVAFGLERSVPPLQAAMAIATIAAARLAADPAGDDLRTLEPAYLRAPRGIGP